MKAAAAVAEILKREGVAFLIGYPVNPIIEAAAEADIRTIIVRQERTGLHMADAVSRIASGERIGVFAMQHGPGAENSFGGVAQAYGDSVPIVVLPAGYPRRLINLPPNFNSFINHHHVTKWAEQVVMADAVPDAMRRAFTQVKNGRPRPVLVEIPRDVLGEDVPEPLQYRPAPRLRTAPDPRDVARVAEALVAAERPVIYAGQGVHYARAWQALRELVELLEAPVTTSLQGKSAFPETHHLSLGSGGRSIGKHLHHFLTNADLIFGIGCSFATTNYGVAMPTGKRIVHATLDPTDLNKDVPAELALIGDAGLTLQALVAEVKDRLRGGPRGRAGAVAQEIKTLKTEWLSQWMPRLTSNAKPLSPYRVLWDLMHTVDVSRTIITHDAGSPRDQISPFWEPVTPLSYIGWGKTTQLGTGLGYAMGAKLAAPDKLCVNVWGDAAIGFTGMDFETAVRERIPILSVLLNNFSMAIELKVMKVATEKYRSTDISGHYADMARAFGGHGERVTEPGEIIPAIKRALRKTEEGVPALLELITEKAVDFSIYGAGARVARSGRAVQGARPEDGRGDPHHAPLLGRGRGHPRRRVLEARARHRPAEARPAADAAVDRRQQRGGDAACRAAGRRLDPLLHHPRAVPRRRREDVRVRGGGPPRGPRRPLRRPRELLARRRPGARARDGSAVCPAGPRGRRDARRLYGLRPARASRRAAGGVRRWRRFQVHCAADGPALSDARAARAAGRRGDPALPPPLGHRRGPRRPPPSAAVSRTGGSGSGGPGRSCLPSGPRRRARLAGPGASPPGPRGRPPRPLARRRSGRAARACARPRRSPHRSRGSRPSGARGGSGT